MKALAKLRVWLRRPSVQIVVLIILVGASSDATEHLVKLYRDGAPLTLSVIGWHLLVLVVLTVTFKHFDRIEARMKRGDA